MTLDTEKDEAQTRGKTNLEIFWLRDESPEVLATEIVEQLEAALEEFRSVESALLVTNSVEEKS